MRYLKLYDGTFTAIPRRFVNIRGQTFGRMTALDCVSISGLGGSRWRFQCEACGSITTKHAREIVHSRSEAVTCGCRQFKIKAVAS